MTFLKSNISSINLYDQLRQRENNIGLQNQPHIFISHLFRERLRVAKNLYKTDLVGHYGCVNAVEFAHGGKFLASGGDDKRVLVWDIEKSLAKIGKPRVLESEHASNIFCLGFDHQNRKIISGGNDDLVIAHDFETGKLVNVFKQDNPVYGLSIDPQNDSLFATASESGKILLFDQRKDPISPLTIADRPSSFHAVEFHPHSGCILITANSRYGAALYDIRMPNQPTLEYMQANEPRTCMSVRFNRSGNLILALRRRLSPILYKIDSPEPVCTFHNKNYYNSCTMKSCTFAGQDDELVISGSDDFNLYVWRISDVDLDCIDQVVEHSQMVLYGHRSIVNQVRYNYQKCLLASSGVEKIVKIWSPFAQNGWSGSLLEEATCSDNPRETFYPFFGSVMTISSLSHDYSSRNTNEDPRMLAFFDTLLRQEIEGSEPNTSTDSSLESDDTSSNFNLMLESSSTSDSDTNYVSTTDSDDNDDDDDDDDNNDDNNDDNVRSIATRINQNHNTKRTVKPKIISKSRTSLLLKRRQASFQHMRRIFRIQPLQQKQSKHKQRQKSKQSLHRQQRHRHKKYVRYLGGSKKNRTLRSLNNSKCKRLHSSSNNKRADFWRLDCDKPTTSAAAQAAASLSSLRKQKNRKKKKNLMLSSCFDLSNISVSSGDNTSSTTMPGTKNNNINNNNNNSSSNNIAEPSTSTGITSSLRDDILCLRRQQQLIIDSDEDDDDDNQNNSNGKSMSLNINQTQRRNEPKKLNGLQNDIDTTVVTVDSTFLHSPPTRSLRNYQGPKNSAALNIDTNQNNQVIAIDRITTTTTSVSVAEIETIATTMTTATATTTTLPQRYPMNSEHLQSFDYNRQNGRSITTAVSRISNKRNKLAKRKQKSKWNFSELYSAESNNNAGHDNIHNDSDNDDDDEDNDFNDRSESSTEQEVSVKVNETWPQWGNQQQQHRNRNNFKIHDDDDDTSIPCLSPTILPSPAKRRKISLADYIKKRQHSNECIINANDGSGDNSLEENNNEQNNNDINVTETNGHENISMNLNGQQTPPRQINSSYYHYHDRHRDNGDDDRGSSLSFVSARIYFTPDSGISLTNSNTPSSAGHAMMYNNSNHYNDAAASTSRAAIRLMPCLETEESNNGDNGFDSLVNNNNNNNNNNNSNNFNTANNSNNNNYTNNKNNNNNNNNKSKRNNLTVFKKKVARIRRNYIRKFTADDSESD